MLQSRAAGILMHPTSLPGGHGIGDLGDEAFALIDYLAAAKQTRWQVLPLGPTGYADSPYASFSSFAGNPLLISLDHLARDAGLTIDLSCPAELKSATRVHYGPVIGWKFPLLRSAAERFLDEASATEHGRYENFCDEHAAWLDDYALFMSIKEVFDARARESGVDGAMWNNYWDSDIALRREDAVQRWRRELRREIAIQKTWQFFFFTQWLALKRYANDRGLSIVGDLPIFVALDSADVWSSPESFMLDDTGRPQLVAGVPPDYFSETGQRWGNPVFNWDVMKKDDFAWWRRRFEGTRNLVDIIRVDHFRGFDACWSIPAEEETAVNGSWVKAPGQALFRIVAERLGEIPILAEDLGVITPEVDRLRDDFGFPGMRILQFAFDAREERSQIFLPHNHHANCVVYTGTHDNDTIAGWFASCTEAERLAVRRYIGHPCEDVTWEFIRMAMASVARLTIIPMQDVLGLGSESRMNTPATQGENWRWRIPPNYRDGDSAQRLAELVEIYQRA